jgi:hypothetical protein
MTLTTTVSSYPLASNLRAAMGVGIVRFVYRKMDGSLRIALGTNDDQLIPSANIPKGTRRMPENMISYWDLTAQDWRSCKTERIERIEAIVVNPNRA